MDVKTLYWKFAREIRGVINSYLSPDMLYRFEKSPRYDYEIEADTLFEYIWNERATKTLQEMHIHMFMTIIRIEDTRIALDIARAYEKTYGLFARDSGLGLHDVWYILVSQSDTYGRLALLEFFQRMFPIHGLDMISVMHPTAEIKDFLSSELIGMCADDAPNQLLDLKCDWRGFVRGRFKRNQPVTLPRAAYPFMVFHPYCACLCTLESLGTCHMNLHTLRFVLDNPRCARCAFQRVDVTTCVELLMDDVLNCEMEVIRVLGNSNLFCVFLSSIHRMLWKGMYRVMTDLEYRFESPKFAALIKYIGIPHGFCDDRETRLQLDALLDLVLTTNKPHHAFRGCFNPSHYYVEQTIDILEAVTPFLPMSLWHWDTLRMQESALDLEYTQKLYMLAVR